MASINFAKYPKSNLVPGTFFEIDASKANTINQTQPSIIIGQKTAAGSAEANVPVIVTGVEAAKQQFGAGSQLALMVERYRAADGYGEVWALPVADASASTATTKTVTFAGTSTAAGTVSVYVAGFPVQIAVAAGETANAIAARFNTAAAANPNLPVTSAVASAVVTLTAKNKGAAAGDIDVRKNYYGAAGGEADIPGLTITFGGTAGATDPDLAPALSALGDTPFDVIVSPYTGAAQMNALQSFLDDTTGRWAWNRKIYGGVFTAFRGNLAAVVTFLDGRNDQHTSVLPVNDSPDSIGGIAAAFGATCAVSLRADPAMPLSAIPLNIKAPPIQSRFDMSAQQTILSKGGSSYVADRAGNVTLSRATNLNNTNAAGVADNSWQDVETPYTLAYCLRRFDTRLSTQFARKKLVADGTPIPGGSNAVTSQTIKGAAISIYRELADENMVSDVAKFIKEVQAENAGNGQVSLYLPLTIANQLRVIAVLVQFTKA